MFNDRLTSFLKMKSNKHLIGLGNGTEGRRRLGGLHGPFVDRSDSSSSTSSDGDIEWLNDSSSSSSDSDGDEEVNVFEIDQDMGGESVG